MHRAARLALSGLVLISVGSALPAQMVRGRVVDSLSGTPVGPGFVVLLDQAGNAVARALSTSTATFSVRAPAPGRYRLRSEIIGYRAAESQELSLDADVTLEYTFEIVALPITLRAVEVQTETRCREDPVLAAATGVVWEEIRKALEAAAWDGTRRAVRYRYYRFERGLRADRRQVTREVGRVLNGFAERPFGSLPAEQLARDGYVVIGTVETHYALPDVEVLLHPAFLGTHCFRVVRNAKQRPGEIGLAFRPVEGRKVAEVRGTMWLDESTSELTMMEIAYTELPEGVEDDRAGGTVEFLRLPSGAWIVARWELRTPVIRVVQREPEPYVHTPRSDARVVGWRDFGGEVLEITTDGGATLYPPNVARVEGTVYDSTRCGPLAGAVVALDSTSYSSTTDGSGRFQLVAPLDGAQAMTVRHPGLDSVRARVPRQVVRLRRGATVTIAITIPRAPVQGSQPCPARPDSTGTRAAALAP